MTDNELLIAFRGHGDESAKAEIVTRHRSGLVGTIARRIGDADAASFMVDAAFDRFFASAVDLDKGSCSYWLICACVDASAGWSAPAADAHRQVVHNVDNSMEEFTNGWPEGEWQRRYEAGIREVFSQPREIDTMNAQAICDAIDTLFGDAGRDQVDTLADMWKIAKRAGAYANLPLDEEEFDGGPIAA